MNEDEQIDLVALTWLGRGDGTIGDWDELRGQAAQAHNNRTAAYLLGIPLLADYLEEARLVLLRCRDAAFTRPGLADTKDGVNDRRSHRLIDVVRQAAAHA